MTVVLRFCERPAAKLAASAGILVVANTELVVVDLSLRTLAFLRPNANGRFSTRPVDNLPCTFSNFFQFAGNGLRKSPKNLQELSRIAGIALE